MNPSPTIEATSTDITAAVTNTSPRPALPHRILTAVTIAALCAGLTGG
ncbi:hypothetical protein GZ198_07185, partial [Dermatophilus congolensis]|nr:hypothetical protein [Dermatophilus congolensis]